MRCHENLIDLPVPPPAPGVFRPNPARTCQLLAVGVAFLAGGCVAWWYWLEGQLEGLKGAVPFLLIPAGVVLAGLQLWNLVRPLRVTLTANGLEVNSEEYRWADVTAVGEQFNSTSRLDGLTVRVRAGTRMLRLSTARLDRLPELLAAIHDNTLDRLTTAAGAAVQAGEVVSFGPIELASTGLRVKRQVIRWHELDDVCPDDEGDVGVWAWGRKVIDVPAGKVDNLRVLLHLVDERRADPAHSRRRLS